MLKLVDPEIAGIVEEELDRQRNNLQLIASENFVSRAVLETQGTVLTNKYAEGYPGRRFYGGCESVDKVETLAIERVKKIFGAEHANVQPHAGAPANLAVFLSCLQPGDVILGMNLAHGGHLTHGSPANISGKYFKAYSYGVDKDSGFLNYDTVRAAAKKCQPRLIIAGASSYPRKIDFAVFREIADEVGAYLMVDMAHIAGLIAAGLHPNPVPYAEFVTGTTHKTLRGPRGGLILCRQEFAKAIDKAVFPGLQGGPLMHTIAAKAVAFKEALQPEFKVYQSQIIKNAATLAGALLEHGYELVSGGTDNHIVLIDLRPQKMTGKEAVRRLEEVGVTVNKNAIPYDPENPFITSGIRLGTPAVTSQGMREEQMREIANLIVEALAATDDKRVKAGLRRRVTALTRSFPVYERDGK